MDDGFVEAFLAEQESCQRSTRREYYLSKGASSDAEEQPQHLSREVHEQVHKKLSIKPSQNFSFESKSKNSRFMATSNLKVQKCVEVQDAPGLSLPKSRTAAHEANFSFRTDPIEYKPPKPSLLGITKKTHTTGDTCQTKTDQKAANCPAKNSLEKNSYP